MTITMDNVMELLEQARDTQPAGFVYGPVNRDYPIISGCFNIPLSDIPIGDMTSVVFMTLETKEALQRVNDPRLSTPCLVAVALNLDGETRHHSHPIKTITGLHKKFSGMCSDDEVVDVLRVAQRAQDDGDSWANAVEYAREVYNAYQSA